jgi:hypothetical protein
MRRHRVKYRRQATHKSNNCYRRHNYYDYIGPGDRTIIIANTACERKALIPSLSLDETMASTNKDSGATRMTGAHMFQAEQHPELDTLGLVAIRDFLKKRTRYLRLVAQSNKADSVNDTPITVVASIDPKLLENFIDMEEIDAESVDDCTNESVVEYLESTQERFASITAEYVNAEVLAKVSINTSEKDPALRVTRVVADYYSLHRNLRLDFINGKPKKTVEHLVSVINPATLKALIESKLEMDMSEPKKDFLESFGYLKKMAIIHNKHCHVVKRKKTGDSGIKNTEKAATLAAAVLDTTLEEAHMEVPATRHLIETERSPDMEGRWTRLALVCSRPESRRLASTRRSVRARNTTYPSVLTLERRSYCPVVRVQKEGKLQNFGQQQSDGGQQSWPDRVSHRGESRSKGHGICIHRL